MKAVYVVVATELESESTPELGYLTAPLHTRNENFCTL